MLAVDEVRKLQRWLQLRCKNYVVGFLQFFILLLKRLCHSKAIDGEIGDVRGWIYGEQEYLDYF